MKFSIPSHSIKKPELLYLTIPLIAFFMLAFCSNVSGQNKNKTKKRIEIIDQEQKEFDKAKILKVKTRTKNVAFYDKYGKLPDKFVIAERIDFDKRGNRKSLTRYKSQSMLDFKYTYNFNSKGNLMEAATFDSKEKMATKRISKYNKKGNETERRIIDYTHNTVSKTFFSYDADGNLIKTRNFDDKGKLLAEIISTYKDGLMISVLTRMTKGDTAKFVNNIYDSEGRVIKEEHSGREGKFEITYKYDSNGNLIEINNPSYKRTYEFDGNNNLVEDKMYLPTGARQFRVQFTYYPDGLQKEEIRYDTDDKPAFNGTYIYEFYKK